MSLLQVIVNYAPTSRIATFIYLIVICLATLMLQACSKDDSASKYPVNELHMSVGDSPEALDPHVITGVPAFSILDALSESLLKFDLDTYEIEPAGAESWKISDDGLRYTFFLDPESRWSNGDSVTAHDYVFAWQRAFMPRVAWPYALDFTFIRGAEAIFSGEETTPDSLGVIALDDYTLEFTLNRPYPLLLNQLTTARTAPIHRKALEKHGAVDDVTHPWTAAGNYVTNGPFRLKSWEVNKIIEVEKNPYYRNAKTVALERIFFHPYDSEASEERAFRSGQIQLAYGGRIPVDKIATYQKSNPELIYLVSSYGTYYYDFNTQKAPMDDPRVRRALAHVIDREALVQFITKAGETPAATYNPPLNAKYIDLVKPLTYDVNKGKELLAEAGFPNGEGFPILTLSYNTSELHRKVALAIQQMWKTHLGISIELENQEWKVFLNTRRNLDFDIARDGSGSDIADPQDALSILISGHGANNTGWRFSDYDSLVLEASKAVDRKKRYEILAQAENLVLAHMPIIPLFYYTHSYLKSESVKGIKFNAISRVNYQDIRIVNDEVNN